MGYAAARYGHVMFPENVHEPALRAAEVLLGGVGKGVLSFLRTVTFAQLELYATLDVMDLKVHFSFRIFSIFSWIYLELLTLMTIAIYCLYESYR